jgi:hypothetical protein
MSKHNGQLTNGTSARAFILAGNARLTLVSVKTGTRFTFRVRAKDVPLTEGAAAPDATKTLFFVQVLNGQDNDSDYAFLGTIFEGTTYRHGRKSSVSVDAPSAKGFAWAWSFLAKGELPPGCEVWHEGKCGRCGRALTVPASIASGIGPKCASGGGY